MSMISTNVTSQGKIAIWVISAVVILVAAASIAIYFFKTSANNRVAQESIAPPTSPLQTLLPTDTPTPSPSASPTPMPITIEIRNGTHVAGLAQKIKDKLTAENFNVVTIGNALNKSLAKTTVYDLTVADADTAQKIAKELSANSNSTLPKGEPKSSADILIILGSNASTIK